jgi:predicted ester cyclase
VRKRACQAWIGCEHIVVFILAQGVVMTVYPNPTANPPQTEARNLVTMRLMMRAFNEADRDLVAQCVAENLISYSPHQAGTERQADEVAVQRAAFPDLYYREEIIIADADMVFLAWQSGGTHTGPMLNTAASGVRFELHGGEVARFRDGLIVEHWDHWLKPRLETYILFDALPPEQLSQLQAGGLL